eukprot:Gb_35508 [translate_table: standard]
MKGHMGIVQEIMLHSPDCLELITNDGKTALHLAIENDKEEVVDHMLTTQHISQYIIDKPDKEGNTALHLATMKTLPRMVSKLLTSAPRVNVNALNKNGETALDMAQRDSELHPEQLRLLEILQARGGRNGTGESNSKEKSHDGPPRKSGDDALNESLVNGANTAALVAALIAIVSFEGILNLFTGIISNGQREIPPHIRDHTHFNNFILFDSLALITSLLGVVGMLCVASWPLKPLGKFYPFLFSLHLIFFSLGFALAACSQALDIALPECKVLERILICTCCLLGWFGLHVVISGFGAINLTTIYLELYTFGIYMPKIILKYFFRHF